MQLEAFFPYRLAVAAELFSRNLMDVYSGRYALSREEWRLLFLLADVDQLTSLDVANRATLDKVQISRAAQKLEQKGLISREVAREDRRLRRYACTQKGKTLFAQIKPQVEARAQHILDAMSEADRKALDQGITALTKAASRARANQQA